jgi:Protein kinase domain/PEGA domain
MAHGRYTIVGKLADGGMAEIFLAMQKGAEGFQKPVVLKRVLTAFSADPQFRNMFLDEAHISMSLAHGNIVQVLDVGVAGERTFLVLELVEGWDLEHVMERAQATGPDHPWPPSLALFVTAQICRGLAYAHAKRGPDGRWLGIVHRDVSPNNVLISEQGEVKLADFGIAKAETKREQTAAGIIKGKIGFMSPEQALGRSLDARADLFSVGALMYLMLTGQRPFSAGSELESLLRAQRAEYQPPEELNPYLPLEATAIVNRAMRQDPAARYQTADEMLVDVERVLRGQYHSAGQTELKLWLVELARRDGVVPMGRTRPAQDDAARPVFVDEGGDLSAGTSVELSDIDGKAPSAAVAMSLDSTAVAAANPPRSSPMPTPPAALAAPEGIPVSPSDTLAAQGALPASAAVPQTDPIPPLARRGLPRRSRVGLGFVLGALCMLGAVFGIRWLAQWAGRERIEISRWLPTERIDGASESVPAQQGPSTAQPSSIPAVAIGDSPRTTASADIPTPAGLGTGQGDGATSAATAASEASPAAGHPPPPDAAPATESDEDEDHLLGRVVPDAATVIGEDEADESARGKVGKTTRPKRTSRTSHEKLETEGSRPSTSQRQASTTAARSQPVQIRITTSPLGAVVRTKKQVLGRTPLAFRFNPGSTYELTFVKTGYVTNSRRLAVVMGKPQSISVAMKKKAPAPPPRRGLFRGR